MDGGRSLGVFLAAGEFTLEGVLVRGTETTLSDGTFGDDQRVFRILHSAADD